MRRATIMLTLVLLAPIARSGAIASQFSAGYEGVNWGTSLVALVGMFPGGEHYFSTSPGERVYIVANGYPLFGVPRQGMKIYYHMGKGDVVETIGVAVPYERRDQLLGVLLSLFGSYTQEVVNKRMVTVYAWPRDNGIMMAVRASTDPTNGILEFVIARPSNTQHVPPT